VEKGLQHLEEGIRLEREERFEEARRELLRAAEFLFKAAEKSPPRFKESRVAQAEKVLSRALALKRKAPAASIPQKADEGAPALGWLVREKPDVRLDDVAGLEEVKEKIRLRLIYPFTHPELAARYGIKKGGGILLYGPPGTGKTMLARAVAGELDAAFFTVKPSEIMSKWVGEAEQNIARLFDAARSFERSVVFIDEVEALIPRRRDSSSTVMQRVVPQILAEMEGFKQSKGGALLFIGATNEPWAIDEAALRPGRFDEKIYVPLPDRKARYQILLYHLRDKPLAGDVDLEELAGMLEGYSGADIRHICEAAADAVFLESIRTGEARDITKADLLLAVQKTRPSVPPKTLEKFEKFA